MSKWILTHIHTLLQFIQIAHACPPIGRDALFHSLAGLGYVHTGPLEDGTQPLGVGGIPIPIHDR